MQKSRTRNTSKTKGKPLKTSFIRNGEVSSNLELITPTWFHNLPVYILIQIFQNFTEEELQNSIIPVCQQWRYAALRPTLWKKLIFRGKNVPTTFICNKIRSCTQLETIFLSNVAEPVTVIRQISMCTPNLKNFALRHSSTIPEKCLRNLLRCCKFLESVDLSGTEFNGNSFYQELSMLKNLQCINFSNNRHLNSHNLTTAILNTNRLKELKLSTWCPQSIKNQLNDNDAKLIFSTLASSLESLAIDALGFTNVAFQTLTKCNKLERICLYGATNLSGELLTQFWKHFPKLKQLKIKRALQVTDHHLIQFCEFSEEGKLFANELVLLDLTACFQITNLGLNAVANCCPNLQSLILKSCKNVTNLTRIRDKCTKLELLNVAFCTNLDPNTLMPPIETLKNFIIYKSKALDMIAVSLMCINPDINIFVSLSEYNKKVEKYT